jgi:transcription initiation factor TFIIIB Brf1 subunit/transcription initiation factor TFIIB
LRAGDLTCSDCGVVQRSSLVFTGSDWGNESTTHREEVVKSKVTEATCADIEAICERLELDASVCSQAMVELDTFYKVKKENPWPDSPRLQWVFQPAGPKNMY